MVGVILTVLKVIGIILLCILLLLLTVVMVVLLVPIRYQGEASYLEGKPRASVTVHWLLHLIHVKAGLEENEFYLQLRLAGFSVFPRKKKTEKRHQAVSPEKKEASPERVENLIESSEIPKKPGETMIEAVYDPASQPDPQPDPQPNPQQDSQLIGLPMQQPVEASGEMQQNAVSEKHMNTEEKMQGFEEKRINRENQVQNKKDKEKKGKEKKEKKKKENKAARLWSQFCSWKELLLSEPMKKAISKVVGKIVFLLRHILPRKISGRVHFGFDDPSLTGKILAYLAMIYPIAEKYLRIEPEFQQKILEGNLEFRGRIRIGTIAVAVLSILLDKNIRRQYKLIRQGGKKHGKAAK